MFPRYPDGVYRPPIADVAHDASTSAALSEVAAELSAARSQGRLIQSIKLDQIDADYLVRDRLAVDADEMAALVESIRARGQQSAIEVTQLEDGRYGLISGWRRLEALRQLQGETPEIDSVLVITRTPHDAADAYLAMVEENEIRVGLSYYERARIVARAVDRGVYRADRVALAALFHAVSRSKRSKIGAFVRIVRALDDDLRFPTALSERAGLALAQALEANPALEGLLQAALRAVNPLTAQAEAVVIAQAQAPKAKVKPPKPVTTRLSAGLAYSTQADGRIILEGTSLADRNYVDRLVNLLKTFE
jgi:ParB/RepB/Spo0J family partition protein